MLGSYCYTSSVLTTVTSLVTSFLFFCFRWLLTLKIFLVVAIRYYIQTEEHNKTGSRPKKEIKLCETMKLLMKQPESGSEIQINYANKLYNFLISMSPPDSLIK